MPRNQDDFHIWEGIHDAFPDIALSSPWQSETWVDKLYQEAQSRYRNLSNATQLSTESLVHEYPLPPLIATMVSETDQSIRILDFGGGMGISYLALLASLPDSHSVDYWIVEAEAICQRSAGIFNGDPHIHFVPELPNTPHGFQVIHAGSSLHYVKEWQDLLKRFKQYKPEYMVFSGLTAGAIKTFVTYQNYYGMKTPVWFWNIDQFVDTVRQLGFTLIYHSLLASRYLGKVQPLPMDNFPSEYGLPRKCNLIFRASNGPA